MSVFLEKVGDKYYGEVSAGSLKIPVHKEFIIDSAADVANLPGIAECAAGSIATDAGVTLVYRLSNDGVWTKL